MSIFAKMSGSPGRRSSLILHENGQVTRCDMLKKRIRSGFLIGRSLGCRFPRRSAGPRGQMAGGRAQRYDPPRRRPRLRRDRDEQERLRAAELHEEARDRAGRHAPLRGAGHARAGDPHRYELVRGVREVNRCGFTVDWAHVFVCRCTYLLLQ